MEDGTLLYYVVDTTTGDGFFAEYPRLCWVLFIGHSANRLFAECQRECTRQTANTQQTITLGKLVFAECYSPDTRQRAAAINGRQPPLTLCRVSSPDTRQSGDLPSVIFWHSANHIFFHFWPPNFFCSPHTIPGTPCSNVAHFLDFFYISLIYFI